MTSIAASAGGAIIIALVLVVLFVGTAYGLSRRGGGVGSHPSGTGRRDGEAEQAPGAGRASADEPDAGPRDNRG